MLGSARDGAPGAQAPAPPGGETGHLPAPPADCAYAWPAPKWARFRFQQAPAGRGSPDWHRHLRPGPRLPGPVHAGLPNNCAPATTGMRIHRHPPCPLHVRSHVQIPACSIRMRTRTPNAPTLNKLQSVSPPYWVTIHYFDTVRITSTQTSATIPRSPFSAVSAFISFMLFPVK